jgi:hypothetical protein
MKFTDYAESKGILLLRDDITWLRSRLQYVPKTHLPEILKRYVDKWVLGMQECENPVKRQNEGRRAANIYLRELTKCYKAQ